MAVRENVKTKSCGKFNDMVFESDNNKRYSLFPAHRGEVESGQINQSGHGKRVEQVMRSRIYGHAAYKWPI